MLVHTVTEDLHELLQDRGLASITLLSELGGVVIVAVDAALVFVIRVLSTKHSRTDGAREVFNVVLAIQRRDVGAAKCASARKT